MKQSLPRRPFGGSEKQVAKLEATRRVEQRVVRLAICLHLLGLAEARLRLGSAACLMQSVGVGRARAHFPKRIAAAVSVDHGLLGVPYRPSHLAQRQLQLTEVASTVGRVRPIVLPDALF